MQKISQHDTIILRELAKKQLDYANLPQMKELKSLWYRHNDCKGERPMVLIELWTFQDEIMPNLLKCEGEQARSIEQQMLSNIVNFELFHDDRVIPDDFTVGTGAWLSLFNYDCKKVTANDTEGRNIGFEQIHLINDLEQDYEKIQKSIYGVHTEAAQQYKNMVQDIIGDILPVRTKMDCLGMCPTFKIVELMGMENMLFSMYDYPELFKKLMNRIADDTIEYFDWLGQQNLILPTTGFQNLAQGTYCCTKQLPDEEEASRRVLTSKDVWGYMDSQESVGISPEMYEEFIFPCYQKIAAHFGALSYGCCEPVDPIWENCISKLDNLRRVSISPWCNEEYMGEKLRGKNIIYHRKPSPNFIGVGTTLDEDAVRKSFEHTLKAAKGCHLEITQRDVYTINHDINKVKRYVEIIREEIQNHYQP